MSHVKTSILIVEDEAIVAEDLAIKLKRLGYEVCGSSARGEEAIDLAHSRFPDLVLMDIHLQGRMDGVDAAEIIRRECAVPVVFLTAHSDQATLQRAKLAEPFGYIRKPFEDLDLETHIQMAIYKHQAEQKLHRLNASLEQRVAEQTAELRKSNEMLEQRVADRTAELSVANVKLRGLNRTFKALSKSNQALVRATDESQFLREACQIVTTDCGYAMVWVGFAEDNEAKSVRVVAHAGFDAGYLETLNVTWADTERGRGPTGTAIRTGKPSLCRNMLVESNFGPWREEAIKRGYASSLVLPLMDEVKVFGAVTIYSKYPDSFSEEEIVLLAELANDTAQGITAIRLRAARAQALEALQASEERYRALVELSPEPILINRDGRIVYLNPAALELFGASHPEELLGKALIDLFHPDYHERIGQRMHCVANGGTVPFAEERIVRLDGAPVEVEVVASSITTPEGRAAQVILHDITERKKVQEERGRIAAIIESSDDAIVGETTEGMVTSWNASAERLFGYAAAEVIGQSITLIVPPDLRDEESSILERVRRGDHVNHFETVRQSKEGRRIDVSLTISPVRNADGGIIGVSKIVRDFTERKQAENALFQAQRNLQKANESLEDRVAARTAALEAASLKIRQSETRYRSLVTASAQIIWSTNARGEVDADMPTWRAFTGQKLEEIKGSGWTAALHPDDRKRAEKSWSKAVASRAVYREEYRMRRSDGEYRHFAVRGVPVVESDGVVREWVGVASDITDSKAAEDRREVTKALLELFAQKTSSKDYLDGVVEVVRRWTGCDGLGIRIIDEQDEICYKSWAGFEPAFIQLESRLSLKCDNCFCVRAISQKYEEDERLLVTPGGSLHCVDSLAFLRQVPQERLTRYRGKCMKEGFVSLAIVPLRYHDQVLGALHLADHRPNYFSPETVEFLEAMSPLIGEAVQRFRAETELNCYRNRLEELVKQRTIELENANAQLQTEVSVRKTAQDALHVTAEELRRSNQDLEQFAYVASHDLQEPLRAVSGFVQLLERNYADKLDSRAIHFIKEAVEGAGRMQRLINDLLDFSRVGSRGADFSPADLETILKNSLNNLRTSIQETGATITSDPLPTLAIDSMQFGQLFQNLIGNAIKFHSEERPPIIHIGAQRVAGNWEFTVRDNGIGIEPQYFGRVFQIFQRLHTRRAYSGTGIGLAVCKRIVERHGGTIWIESVPGEGSVFHISIPTR